MQATTHAPKVSTKPLPRNNDASRAGRGVGAKQSKLPANDSIAAELAQAARREVAALESNNIQRALTTLQQIPSDISRKEWVEIGMAALAAGLSISDIDAWSATAANYKGIADVERTFKNVNPHGGIGPGTLFYYAEKYRKQPASKSHYSASTKTVGYWNKCTPAPKSQPYRALKHIACKKLRVNARGELVVPCYSPDGVTLYTVQIISKTAKKNLPGAELHDGYFSIGNLAKANRIYVAEGIGQIDAIHQATGDAAVMTFGVSRTKTVVKVLHAQYPSTQIVIVADRGQEVTAEKIARTVNGVWIAMPEGERKNYDANDYAKDHGTAALTKLLKSAQAPALRYKVLSGVDLLNAPPQQWLVHGVLPKKGQAAVFGPSGAGKGFAVIDLGFAVAGGAYDWFGHRIRQAAVTYVCLEGAEGLGKRIAAKEMHDGKPVPEALKFIMQPFNLRSDDVDELAKAIIDSGGSDGLVIIDTLNRAAAGMDENSSKDMGQIIVALEYLQSLVGGLILFVHHTGKDESKGLRGHSSLRAALDAAIEVKKSGASRAWISDKEKDSIDGAIHPFDLKIVSVGKDEIGIDITSCVVVPDKSADAIKQIKRPALGSNQTITYAAISEALRTSAQHGEGDVPKGVSCITYDSALAVAAARIPTDPKHKKTRAKFAITTLVEKGYLSISGNYIYQKEILGVSHLSHPLRGGGKSGKREKPFSHNSRNASKREKREEGRPDYTAAQGRASKNASLKTVTKREKY